MDITRDDNFPRVKAARTSGSRGRSAFPVSTLSGVVAVLEFFTSEPGEPDEVLLQAMSQIGIQLGQVFDRKRAEQALRESEQQFHTLADSIPQLAWMADAAGYIFWYYLGR